MRENELLLCPFCASLDIKKVYWDDFSTEIKEIQCNNCWTTGPIGSTLFGNDPCAIKLWNDRKGMRVEFYER